MSSVDWSGITGWSPQVIEDLRNLGFVYLKQGKFDLARSFFEVLTVVSKENPYDFQTLGAIYLEIGKSLQALNIIEEALILDPHHPPTLINRTKVLFLLGYRRQAVAQAELLIKHPDEMIANQANALLIAYR